MPQFAYLKKVGTVTVPVSQAYYEDENRYKLSVMCITY